MSISSSSFEPLEFKTNSNVKMVEVRDGVYLQGKELRDYCEKRGRCTICAKVKVKKKVVKVFGSNSWEVITAIKYKDKDKQGGEGKGKGADKAYTDWKGNKKFGDDGNIEYLVYHGFCIREGCYTLEQAKRLVCLNGGRLSNIRKSGGSSSRSLGSRSSKSSNKQNAVVVKRSGGYLRKILPRRASSSSSSNNKNNNNPFFSPPQTDKHPLLPVGENPGSPVAMVAIPDVSYKTEVSGLDGPSSHHQRNPDLDFSENSLLENINEQKLSPVVPSPAIRQLFEKDFKFGSDSCHSRQYDKIVGEKSFDSDIDDDEFTEPIREIVKRTISSLLVISSSPVVHTLDLTGLRFRRSEIVALAKIFKAGKNGTVHLTSVVLDNCGIDDDLMEILGQGLYDALWTSNNMIGKRSISSGSGTSTKLLSKSMRHARMRLKSLCLGDNDISNKGIEHLCPYLESIACDLESLDLSRNRIATVGGVTVFHALRRNPQTKIRSIDLSCNLLRELDSTNLDPTQEHNYTSLVGMSYGIQGFLSKNRTLKELDLSANRMTDDGVEALCEGLRNAGDRTALEKLNLAFNLIGNKGASSIGKCLLTNQSLEEIDLNDNYVGNDGGLCILTGLEHNTTLKDISGLWNNKIEKRHIIVSIRKLFVNQDRRGDGGDSDGESDNINARNKNNDDGDDDENYTTSSGSDNVDIYITSGSERTIQTRNGNRNGIGNKRQDEEENIEPSHSEDPIKEKNDDNVSGYLSVEDNGNVSDLSDHEEELSVTSENLLLDHCDENGLEDGSGMMETNQEVTHNLFDRMTIMNSSPLVSFNDDEDETCKAIPLRNTRDETEAIKTAVTTQHLTRGSRIEVREEIATLEKFKAFFAGRDSSVLHFSCHGGDTDDGLIVLENGYGSLETLSLGSLEELVAGVTDTLALVFVSSSRALRIGQAFLAAGVPHVVCCHRDGDKFRDPLAIEFMESFYEHAAQKKNLREAFETSVRSVVASPVSKNLSQVTQRFHLLPVPSQSQMQSKAKANAPVFFQRFLPNVLSTMHQDDEIEIQSQENHFPSLPDHLVGREVEIFELLEALQLNICIEVSGKPGCGKESVVAASLDYALKRRETFSIDQVCWIPARKPAMVDPDSLYGDLILCCDLIRDSSEDLWDKNEDVLDCRERLAIELEGAKVIVVIDNRSFSSKGSRAALEKLVNFIVTYASAAKVLCISATTEENEESDYSAIKTSHVEINALSFRSTALLFGEISEHVSRNDDYALARSAREFVDLADIPFVSDTNNDISGLGDSKRRIDIFERMGKGHPAEVVTAAKSMSRNEFDELMKVINRPEIHVESLSELENEVSRWKTFVDLAISERNYKRAVDLQATIDELDGMRLRFCSLKDLKAKEKSMKLQLAEAVSNRRYDVANELKRDLLGLKKKIMKERRVAVENSEVLNDFKAQVDSLANALEHDESLVSREETKSFEVDCDGHTCTFLIYSGSVFDPKSFSCSIDRNEQCNSESVGIVCWSNEACELEGTLDGKLLLELEAERFKECIGSLPIVEETRHGSVRCLMGNSLIISNSPPTPDSGIDTGTDGHEKMVPILTVGPFASQSGQIDALMERDNDYRRFGITTLRSCYRTCVGQTKQAKLETLVVRPLTTRTKNGPLYEETLKVAVRAIAEEAKFSSLLREVHIVGNSPKEASLLVGIMIKMGYDEYVLPISTRTLYK